MRTDRRTDIRDEADSRVPPICERDYKYFGSGL